MDKNVEDQEVRYGCLNLACKDVFGQWISAKLKYLALVGFTATLIYLVTLGMALNIWKKLSNGFERIMWHHRLIEALLLMVTLLIIFVGSIICGVSKPNSPSVFPFAQ